jgi:hypothetical protein
MGEACQENKHVHELTVRTMIVRANECEGASSVTACRQLRQPAWAGVSDYSLRVT